MEVLEAERPQQKVKELETNRSQHKVAQVPWQKVLPKAEQPPQEVAETRLEELSEVDFPEEASQHKVLLEADRPQQQGTEVLEAEKSEQKVQGETQEVLLDAERPQQQVVEVLEAKRPQHKGPQVLHEVGKPQNDKRTELPEAGLPPSSGVSTVLPPSDCMSVESSPSIARSARLVRVIWDPGGWQILHSYRT